MKQKTTNKIYLPSYGDCVGPRIMTLKYRILSSDGEALIPGADADHNMKYQQYPITIAQLYHILTKTHQTSLISLISINFD